MIDSVKQKVVFKGVSIEQDREQGHVIGRYFQIKEDHLPFWRPHWVSSQSRRWFVSCRAKLRRRAREDSRVPLVCASL